MKSQESRGSGRRRGGGRRPRNSDETPRPSYPPASAPQSFWQKIISFFSPAPKSSNGARAKSESNRPARAVPAYTPRAARKPEAVEVTSPKLYVGNLSYAALESDLSELFSGVGKVTNSEVVSHKDSERSKGFGFVTMTTVEEARRAVLELHDKEFMGRKLVVSGAKTPA